MFGEKHHLASEDRTDLIFANFSFVALVGRGRGHLSLCVS
jgi:hypothetical protein